MWLRPSVSVRIKPFSVPNCKRSSVRITSQSQTSSVQSRILIQRQSFSVGTRFNPIRHPEALNPFENISAPLKKQTLSQEEKQQIYDKIKQRVLSNKPKLSNPYAVDIEVQVNSFKSGEPVDTIRFLPEVWNVPLRPDILQRVVVWQLAKKRMGSHKQKDRSEVRGGGRKPWKQKKQGRARAGSIRSPIWVGGGRALAKRPRNYYFPLSRNVRSMGLKVALTSKFLANKVTVVDDLKLESHKTKNLSKLLTEKGLLTEKLLLVSHEYRVDRNLELASGNLPLVDLLPVRGVNTHSILRADRLFITKQAVSTLQDRLINRKKYKRIKTVYE